MTGDKGKIADDVIDYLCVILSFAVAAVNNNLFKAGNLHRALVVELLHQRGSNIAIIKFFKSRHS